MSSRWLAFPRWRLVSRQDNIVTRAPRRIRVLAKAEAAILSWRYPRREVTVEQNK